VIDELPCRPARRDAIGVDLDANDRLLARHLGAAVQRFGAAALDVIDLPPLISPADSQVDAEQIRVAAVLLWAREIEEAGLPGFVEALAEGLIRGRLTLPLTTGADRLMRYYRGRDERFGREERHALYARAFGEPGERNHPFASSFGQMVTILSDIGRAGRTESLSPLQARLRIIARQLGEQLSTSAGLAAFAARDIVAHIREAVEILHDADVSHALGDSGLWSMIRLNGPAIAGHEFNPTPHLIRARAGQQILSWLADAVPSLDSVVVDRADPVVEGAQAWEATPAE
jgi:hypothetical protein